VVRIISLHAVLDETVGYLLLLMKKMGDSIAIGDFIQNAVYLLY